MVKCLAATYCRGSAISRMIGQYRAGKKLLLDHGSGQRVRCAYEVCGMISLWSIAMILKIMMLTHPGPGSNSLPTPGLSFRYCTTAVKAKYPTPETYLDRGYFNKTKRK